MRLYSIASLILIQFFLAQLPSLDALATASQLNVLSTHSVWSQGLSAEMVAQIEGGCCSDGTAVSVPVEPVSKNWFRVFKDRSGKLWEQTLGRPIRYLRNNRGVLVVFMFLLFIFEILSSLFKIVDGGTAELIFNIVSIAAIGLYGVPMIWAGILAVARFLKLMFQGKNPFPALGIAFTRGMSLLLFLILPFVVAKFPMKLPLVALIAVIIQIALVMKKQMATAKDRALANLKQKFPADVRVLQWGNQTYSESAPLIKTVDEVAVALQEHLDVVLLIGPGELIPKVDGEVVSVMNAPQVSRFSFTGETTPCDVVPGDELEGGSQLINGSIMLRVSKAGGETALGQLEQSMGKLAGKSEVDGLLSKAHAYFGLAVLIVVVVSFLVTGSLTASLVALAVICPCAFFVGVPLSLEGAKYNVAKKNGVFVYKNESFSPLHVLVLDKTGTLTDPKLTLLLDESQSYGDVSKQDALFWAAAMERQIAFSKKGYARAFWEAALVQGFSEQDLGEAILHDQAYEDKAVVATLSDYTNLYLGSYTYLKDQYVLPAMVQQRLDRDVAQLSHDGTAVVMYDLSRNRPVALFKIGFYLRPGADRLVDGLKQIGRQRFYHKIVNWFSRYTLKFEPFPGEILPLIASGDNRQAVFDVLGKTNIKLGLAEMTYAQKADLVHWLQKHPALEKLKSVVSSWSQGRVFTWNEFQQEFAYERSEEELAQKTIHRVGMIGDGINDAPALSAADVGFSFQAATEHSKSSADVLLGDDERVFDHLNDFLKMQRRAYAVIFINIFFIAIVYNVVMIALLFSGKISPVVGALLHAANSLLVVFVALSLIPKPWQYYWEALKEMVTFKNSLSEQKVPAVKSPKSGSCCGGETRPVLEESSSCCGGQPKSGSQLVAVPERSSGEVVTKTRSCCAGHVLPKQHTSSLAQFRSCCSCGCLDAVPVLATGMAELAAALRPSSEGGYVRWRSRIQGMMLPVETPRGVDKMDVDDFLAWIELQQHWIHFEVAPNSLGTRSFELEWNDSLSEIVVWINPDWEVVNTAGSLIKMELMKALLQAYVRSQEGWNFNQINVSKAQLMLLSCLFPHQLKDIESYFFDRHLAEQAGWVRVRMERMAAQLVTDVSLLDGLDVQLIVEGVEHNSLAWSQLQVAA